MTNDTQHGSGQVSKRVAKETSRMFSRPHSIVGKFVECIGPSGAGKTTIIKDFRKYARHSWFFEYETEKSRYFRGIFSKSNLEQNIDYRELLVRKVLFFQQNSEISADHKQKLFQWFPERLIQDASLFVAEEHKSRGFWFDDGILHLYGSQFLELFKEGRLSEIPLQRVLIFLHTDIQTNIDRLRKRSMNNPDAINNWVGLLGEEKAREMALEALTRGEQLYEFWTRFGGLAYKLDITNTESALSELTKIENEVFLF